MPRKPSLTPGDEAFVAHATCVVRHEPGSSLEVYHRLTCEATFEDMWLCFVFFFYYEIITRIYAWNFSYPGARAGFFDQSLKHVAEDLCSVALLRPIYTVRLCRIRQAYDRPTTWIVSCKSNLQLAYDCCLRQKKCRRILKHVLKRCDNRSQE